MTRNVRAQGSCTLPVGGDAAGTNEEVVARESPPPAVITASLLLDAGEAAQLLGIGRSTFYRFDEAGVIPRCVRLGRLRRWRDEELRAWIAEGCPPRVRWEAR